jgi:hypothetical protein
MKTSNRAKRSKTSKNWKVDGSRPHKVHQSSSSHNRRKRVNKSKRASVTRATLMTPPRLPSSGLSTSGRARNKLINEY